MPTPKESIRDGKRIHYSVGAFIERDGKYLLIERAIFPMGFAGPAGHVDEDESPEESIKREVREETGLEVTNLELLFDEFVEWNYCSKGVTSHHWYVFRCEVEGELNRNKRETKSIGWYSKDEINNLDLEEVWKYWFGKLD